MAVTPNGTKINFYNTDWSTYKTKLGTAGAIKDGSLFFINDGSNGGGRIYNGSNLLANVGFEEFKFSTSGTGSFITGITPTAYISDDDKLTLELVGALGNPAAAGNGAFTILVNNLTTPVSTPYKANVSQNTVGLHFQQGLGTRIQHTMSAANVPEIHISHADVSATVRNASSIVTPYLESSTYIQSGSNTTYITYVSDVSLDTFNHVTGLKTKSVGITIPSVNINNAILKIKSNSDTTGVQVFTANSNTASSFQIKGGASAEGESGKIYVKTTTTTANAPVVTISHATTGTAGNYGPSANVTATAGSETSVTIPYITTDSTGHVSASNKTLKFTIPNVTGAMHYLGVTSTTLTDGATTNPVSINSSNVTATPGDVVLSGTGAHKKEYVWNGSNWNELGYGDPSIYIPRDEIGVYGDGTYLEQNGGKLNTSDVTISHKTLLATGTAGTAYGSTTAVPVIKVDAAGHVTSVSSSNIAFPAAAYGYGKITPANNTSTTTALTGNTTQILAASSNENFKFEAANKWLSVAGTNSGTAGSDVLKIGHSAAGVTTADSSTGTLSNGGTFVAISSITTDEAKHVTGFTSKTYTLPTITNTDNAYVVANSAEKTQANLTANSTANGAFINVWSNQTANDTTIVNKHSIKLYGVRDVSVSAEKNGVISIGHTNPMITANSANGFKTFSVDAYGHVTSYTVKTAGTFTVKARLADSGLGTSDTAATLTTHTDFGTAADLTFTRPDSSVGRIDRTGLCIQGGSGETWFDFGPVWQTL